MVMVAGSTLWAAAASLAIATAASSGNAIVNDTHFYGQSPPVYPSPRMAATGGAWADAHAKARDLVSRMTLLEKVSLTGGATVDNGCSGNVAAIPRLGFPGMCLSDAGQGLRATDFVSSFPSGIHVGASWNRDLAARRGAAMADEFKKKGVNVLLGPVVGPAWRVARGGRNWEGFAADPYLSGSLAAQSVEGIQGQGVITSVKHYIGNEQETNRNPSGSIQAVSSNIDDRTMHEMYLWPFQDAVHAGSGNIMCSYQRINNSYGCANSKTLNGLLKTELGFQGFVVSDWGAQHTGYAGALAGMDMAMPDPGSFWGDKLVESVKNGSVPESRIDDMATRILTPWYQFNQDKDFPNPGSGMPKDITKPHVIVDARDPAASSVLFDGAVEGHVLVKNTNSTLPLRHPRLLSVFGYSAKTPDLFAPGAGVLQTYQWQLGAETVDPSAALGGLSGAGANIPSISINGTLFSGCGSGATTPALAISPLDALTSRAHRDGTALFVDLASPQPVAHPASDACLVFGNAFACEAYDRPGLLDAHTDALVKAVANSCARTVVVLHNAGPRLLEGFVDHPNVTAVVLAHLPGQESGPALAALLYGDAAPSGKLPYTVAKNEDDYPALRPSTPSSRFVNFPQSDFSEGVHTDYRHFDRAGITPRFEFGFGLSYTTFAVSNLTVQRVAVRGSVTAPLDEFPSGAVLPGGPADLWDNVALVTAEVRNTGGERAGAEVVQLYVGIPDDKDGSTPGRQLRGYEKVSLPPGETATVTMALSRRDLSIWDVGAQGWRLRRGTYRIEVGTSSRDLPLQATLEI